MPDNQPEPPEPQRVSLRRYIPARHLLRELMFLDPICVQPPRPLDICENDGPGYKLGARVCHAMHWTRHRLDPTGIVAATGRTVTRSAAALVLVSLAIGALLAAAAAALFACVKMAGLALVFATTALAMALALLKAVVTLVAVTLVAWALMALLLVVCKWCRSVE